MSLQELHQTRGMDPTYLRRRQVAVGRVVERLCGFLIYDDGYSLSEVDTSSGDEDDVLFTDSGSDHASSTCIDEEDGRSHRYEDNEPAAEALTPARVPVIINYEAEDELDAAVYYYAMRDAEENALSSNPWSWSEERVALPDAAVHMALRDCVIAFEKDAQPCSICLAPMRLGKRVAQLPCRHHFCRPCVVTWLKMAPTRPHCPICRAAVPIPRFHGPTSSSAPHSSQHPARSTGGVAPRHHHRSHHAQRRWERLMAEEEAALQQAMATQSLPQLPSRAKSNATSTEAPSQDDASRGNIPTSPTASFDELEKKSAWLRDFMESRRREDRIQRAREEGTRPMPPLPRVATLAKTPKRSNAVTSSASHSPKHLLPSPRR